MTKIKSQKINKELINLEIPELPQNTVKKEKNFLLKSLIGSIVLGTSLIIVVVVLVGISYLINP
jgi:hypothetical protein